MKDYLENLCNELDYKATILEGEDDWKEQILNVIFKNLFFQVSENKLTIQELLFDMNLAINAKNGIHPNGGIQI